MQRCINLCETYLLHFHRHKSIWIALQSIIMHDGLVCVKITDLNDNSKVKRVSMVPFQDNVYVCKIRFNLMSPSLYSFCFAFLSFEGGWCYWAYFSDRITRKDSGYIIVELIYLTNFQVINNAELSSSTTQSHCIGLRWTRQVSWRETENSMSLFSDTNKTVSKW